MKKKAEGIIAVIFLIMLTMFLFMALTAGCYSSMDPIREQIKEESIIF